MDKYIKIIQEREVDGLVSIKVLELVGSCGIYYEVHTQLMKLFDTKATVVKLSTIEKAIAHGDYVYNNFTRLYSQIDDIMHKSLFSTPDLSETAHTNKDLLEPRSSQVNQEKECEVL